MAETIRIEPEAYASLRAVADEQGVTLQIAVGRAIEAFKTQLFLEGLARDFEALRADPVAWAEEVAERELWDSAYPSLEDE